MRSRTQCIRYIFGEHDLRWLKIDENKLTSAFSQSKSKGGWFLGRNPNFIS